MFQSFTDEWVERYSRQLILPEVGAKGQRKLAEAKVLVIGAGGIGSPVSLYLAAAGVGRIGIVDSDDVELSNLQRQILHTTCDISRPKVVSAKEKLETLNPDVEVVPYCLRLTSENITDIISDYDLVVDGSDNFATRYLVNDACVLSGKPLSSGAILRFEAQATTILPRESACYRCIFPAPPPPGLVPSCQEAGVIGTVCGLIGSVQATEVIKLILGKGELLSDWLFVCDLLSMEFRKIRLRRDRRCPVCGDSPTITQLIDYEEFCRLPYTS
ncbi:MAG: HesA/MoeB/ThiF family protein [Armatimonadetes bacterium]|nr:HesA/MoeB/ThiF family protein [Armatimonadota bacterium]